MPDASEATNNSTTQDFNDMDGLQALCAHLSSMTCDHDIFSAMTLNDVQRKQFEEYLRPVIEAISRQNDRGHSPDAEKSVLMSCIEKLIIQDVCMISEFEKFKMKCETDHLNCNIAKTVGTSVAVIGTVMTITGLFFAIPTGGASLLLTLGGGSAAMLGGTTNAGTEITKNILLKSVKTKIKVHLNARRKLQKEYQGKMNIFNEIVDDVLSSGLMSTVSEARALVYILTELGRMPLTSVTKYMKKMKTFIHELNTGQRRLGNTKTAAAAGEAEFVGLGKTVKSELSSVAKVIVGAQGAQCGALATTIFPLRFSTKLPSIVAKSTILGVVFVAVDIGFLVKDWLSVAEYVKEISAQVGQLKNELKCLDMEKENLDWYRKTFGRNSNL